MRVDHRPWPVPSGPWLMRQIWSQLLFAHWPVKADQLRSIIPRGLELDLYKGQAWMGIVPFYMSGIRMHYMPSVPGTSDFGEINVRTYVISEGKAGVYFFSLDAANSLAVLSARMFFHLPYYRAGITLGSDNGWTTFRSERRGTGAGASASSGEDREGQSFLFDAQYRPTSAPFMAEQESLEYWLTERYCLYAEHGDHLYRCNINHEPWQLQHAEAKITINTMVDRRRLELPSAAPRLHYAERLEAVTWGLERVR
ncbi:DUF2071 domain-containing protein [Paenibacillus sp. PR3]|uniref:DUF2071 domain-containing protein n=1 Tax=Paenibacillus terricola TaxID=2763503 RepID=A0ABR8N117_9BACL|nr:DUF2071 domain-containing protein [Paenibacillus terricola]MBD3921878.1 DUF2071 domain-containing protein [Paenibacillus terricola]